MKGRRIVPGESGKMNRMKSNVEILGEILKGIEEEDIKSKDAVVYLLMDISVSLSQLVDILSLQLGIDKALL